MKRLLITVLFCIKAAAGCGETTDATDVGTDAPEDSESGMYQERGSDCTGMSDCNGDVSTCCGCIQELDCVNGHCVTPDNDYGWICYDAGCCFSPLGCGDGCSMVYPEDFSDVCGDTTCYLLDDDIALSCCTVEDNFPYSMKADACGVNVMYYDSEIFYWNVDACVQLNQPGTTTGACPDIIVTPSNGSLPGCCTAQGVCGGMIDTPPIGCATQTLIQSLYSTELEEEISCSDTAASDDSEL